MPLILSDEKKNDALYLDTCRTKRNAVEYDYVGGASDRDADELIAFTLAFRSDVLGWLETKHPELMEGSRP